MSASDSSDVTPPALLSRHHTVILVMDLVESVRLMEAREADLVMSWRAFVHHARAQVLPRLGGRMVKSLGDGIMAEFSSAAQAATAALELHRYFDAANRDLPPDQRRHLRAGLNLSEVYADELDIYGSGVNLASRVATLAGPGETMVTAVMCRALQDPAAFPLADMGECYLKHVSQPVRVYRLGEAGQQPVLHQDDGPQAFVPRIAVLPVQASPGIADGPAVAELLTDHLVQLLSRQPQVRVLSRLSSYRLSPDPAHPDAKDPRASADFVVASRLALIGAEAATAAGVLSFELLERRNPDICHAGRQPIRVADLLAGESAGVHEAVREIVTAVGDSQFTQARLQPIPSLPSHVILHAAIRGMHTRTDHHVNAARQMLQALSERHPRASQPLSWLAKWHILQAGQGGTASRTVDHEAALTLARKAMDLAGDDPLALTMHGIVLTHLVQDHAAGQASLQQALAIEPSNALASLYMGALLSFTEPGPQAVDHCRRALALAQFDPTRYLYEGMMGTACFGVGDYLGAIEHSRASLDLNPRHASSLRVLAMALALAGQEDEARLHAQAILAINPRFNRADYRTRFRDAPAELLDRFDAALAIAGIPKDS
jgi:adenylate cyclase